MSSQKADAKQDPNTTTVAGNKTTSAETGSSDASGQSEFTPEGGLRDDAGTSDSVSQAQETKAETETAETQKQSVRNTDSITPLFPLGTEVWY